MKTFYNKVVMTTETTMGSKFNKMYVAAMGTIMIATA